MRPRLLSDVARAVDGRLEGDDAEVRSVVTDSREIAAGSLFVALLGDRIDGHAFVDEAFAAGAAGAIVSIASTAASAARRAPRGARSVRRRRTAAAITTQVSCTGLWSSAAAPDSAAPAHRRRYFVQRHVGAVTVRRGVRRGRGWDSGPRDSVLDEKQL